MLREAREVLGEGRPLVAYRWMPDPYLAAVMLADALVGQGLEPGFAAFTGHHVTMGLVERLARASRSYDSLVLLGPGWRGPEIDLLASNILAPVLVVDIHYNPVPPRRPNVVYFNPSPRGDPRGIWPSVTFVTATILGDTGSLLVAASIVALLGVRSVAVRAYQNSMASNGLHPSRDLEIPEMCAVRAAGLTAMGDPESMSGSPLSIAEASLGDVCRAILDDALLAAHAGMLEEALVRYSPGTLVETGEDGDALRLLLARNSAYTLEAPAAAGSAEHVCAWVPGRHSSIEIARSAFQRGLRGVAASQGLVNYACISGRGALEWAREAVSRPR